MNTHPTRICRTAGGDSGTNEKLGYPVEAPYGNLAQDLTVAGYGELFNEDVEKCIRKLLMRDTVVFEKGDAC